MIAKIIMGNNVRGLLRYLTKKEHSVLTSNHLLPDADVNYLTSEIKQISDLNTRVKKNVMHFVLAFPESDNINVAKMTMITDAFMKLFGAADNQWISIKHEDSENHQHCHVLLNRVKMDGSLLKDSFSIKKAMRISRYLEIEFKLKQVSNEKKIGNNKSRDLLKTNIDFALIISKTFEQFVEEMAKRSYKVNVGSGITFTDITNGVTLKGSAIARNYSLKHIKERVRESVKDQYSNKRQNLSKGLQQEQQEIEDIIEIEQDNKTASVVGELFDTMIGDQYVGESSTKKKKKKKEQQTKKRRMR